MMQVVRADPKRFGWNEKKVKRYERLLVSLDQTVMAGAMFQSCVEADFESPQEDDGDDGGRRIDIMDNRVFLKEFFTLLSEDLNENIAGIGHPAEMEHRLRLMVSIQSDAVSNVAVIIIRTLFINAFLFHCLLLNHSFSNKPKQEY